MNKIIAFILALFVCQPTQPMDNSNDNKIVERHIQTHLGFYQGDPIDHNLSKNVYEEIKDLTCVSQQNMTNLIMCILHQCDYTLALQLITLWSEKIDINLPRSIKTPYGVHNWCMTPFQHTVEICSYHTKLSHNSSLEKLLPLYLHLCKQFGETIDLDLYDENSNMSPLIALIFDIKQLNVQNYKSELLFEDFLRCFHHRISPEEYNRALDSIKIRDLDSEQYIEYKKYCHVLLHGYLHGDLPKKPHFLQCRLKSLHNINFRFINQ